MRSKTETISIQLDFNVSVCVCVCACVRARTLFLKESRHQKTNNLHMRKQRRRSAVQKLKHG